MNNCAYRYCHKPPRPGGRFCSSLCRYKQWDLEHPRANREGAVQRARRASRDGTGIRIYLTPDELETVTAVPTGYGPPDIYLRALRKIREARERMRQRRENDGDSDTDTAPVGDRPEAG